MKYNIELPAIDTLLINTKGHPLPCSPIKAPPSICKPIYTFLISTYRVAKTAEEEFLKELSDNMLLCDLKVGKHVKTVFELNDTDNITNKIIAVPAGKKVLPDLKCIIAT